MKEFKAGGAGLTLDVLGFLASWLPGPHSWHWQEVRRWLKYEAKAPMTD